MEFTVWSPVVEKIKEGDVVFVTRRSMEISAIISGDACSPTSASRFIGRGMAESMLRRAYDRIAKFGRSLA